MRKLLLLTGGLLIFSACNFSDATKMTSAKFSDQNFKTSISLIELYKIRYGSYPENLRDLKYMGAWDSTIYVFVEYERLDTGYRLDVKPGPFNGQSPDLSFPADFWRGLGLRRSNVRRIE